jgi:hypothetical protein
MVMATSDSLRTENAFLKQENEALRKCVKHEEQLQ